MKRLLLVGPGKWGKNYITTLHSFDGVELSVANRHNWKQLIDEQPDGVMIATPPQSHVEIADYALKRNIATMIEKPLSLSYKEAQALAKYRSPILVNHIHLFSESFQKLKDRVNLSTINKIVSLGYGDGPKRDYSGLWDYGCHDLSMILYLADKGPISVNCQKTETATGSLFKIDMEFSKFTTESLVGNGGKHRVRKFKVETDGLQITYNDKNRPAHHLPPLTSALRVFLDAINGIPDDRLGVNLSLEVLNILEECGPPIDRL